MYEREGKERKREEEKSGEKNTENSLP